MSGSDESSDKPGKGTTLVGAFVLLVLSALGAGLFYGVSRGPKIVPGRNAGWLETVFASRGTVGVVRLAIIFACGYLVISVCALIFKGQWLSRVGPIEIAQSVKRVDKDSDQLATELATAKATIDTLEDEAAALAMALNTANERLKMFPSDDDTMNEET